MITQGMMTKKLLIGITVLLASCNTNVDMVEQQVDELYAKMTQKERRRSRSAGCRMRHR